MKIKITNPRGVVEYEFKCDATEFTYKDVDGGEMKAKATWDENETTLTEDGEKAKDGKKTKLKMVRYIKNGEMNLELINKDGVKTIRIFKKVPNKK